MHTKPKLTLQEAARRALEVQDACNGSGVARFLSDVFETLWAEADKQHKGTDWVNQHPIVCVVVDKLSSLARTQSNTSRVSHAYHEVEALAGGRLTYSPEGWTSVDTSVEA